ncbi:putative protein phosphatase 2C 12 isoform X1 [Canna indica]|uniref:protein-serine/threonine phosphatase n=1 Tax=Canna indica TaxID=4628 RepID=A0AAQ3JXF1_9LILI|nr:putative protein phosphatase 2C 12 isoform X1 [Canna indica]
MGICSSSASLDFDENFVYVLEDDDDGPSPDKRIMKRLACLYSLQGKKGLNQDSAILCKDYGMEEGVFIGVFDGHGRSGHIVSRLVREYLPALLLSQHNALLLDNEDLNFTDGIDASSVDGEDFSDASPDMFDEWKEACINAFRAMDNELKHHPDLDCSYSGSTAVSIIKQGKNLIIANLGDSRAVLGTVSEEGRLEAVQLTTDFKPNVPQEAERIRKNNGRVFARKDEPQVQRVWLPNDDYPGLAMARAFGDFELKNYGVISIPQVVYHRLTNRDQFVVLATDGVWDVLNNDKVVSIVSSIRNKRDASRAVVEAAVRAWRFKFPASRVDDCSAACLFF